MTHLLTRDDVHSTCPLSERPGYVVFSRHESLPQMAIGPFWKITAVMPEIDRALAWANAVVTDDGTRETCLVYGCRWQEANNLYSARRLYSDTDMGAFTYAQEAAE